MAHVCCHACRRLSALAGAATAVKSAMTALNTLMSGGDDQNGGPVQCNLLIQAAAAVPEQTSLPMQAIQAIESSLTYPEPTAKVSCVLPHMFTKHAVSFIHFQGYDFPA